MTQPIKESNLDDKLNDEAAGPTNAVATEKTITGVSSPSDTLSDSSNADTSASDLPTSE